MPHFSHSISRCLLGARPERVCVFVCTCMCGIWRLEVNFGFFPPQVPSTLNFWDIKFLWPSAYPNRQEWLTSRWERFFHLCLPRLRNMIAHYHIQLFKNMIFFLNGIHFHPPFSSLDPLSHPPSNYSYVLSTQANSLFLYIYFCHIHTCMCMHKYIFESILSFVGIWLHIWPLYIEDQYRG